MTKRFDIQEGENGEEARDWVEPVRQTLSLQGAIRSTALGNVAAALCFTIMWSACLGLTFGLRGSIEDNAMVSFILLGLGVVSLWVAVFLVIFPRSEAIELWGGNRPSTPSSDRAQMRRSLERLRVASGFGGVGALLGVAGVIVIAWS